MTSDTPAAGRHPIALLHRVWDARAAGDLSVLEAALAPDATWRGIDDGPWNCESCAGIMRVLRQNPTHGLDGRIEETIPYGERSMVAVPTLRGLAQRSPARRRIAYAVVTVHDGAITEIKSCATRESAEDYATTGRTSAPGVKLCRRPTL